MIISVFSQIMLFQPFLTLFLILCDLPVQAVHIGEFLLVPQEMQQFHPTGLFVQVAGKVQQIYSDKFFILVTSVEKAKNVVLRLRNRFFRATIDEQVCLFDFYERIKSGGKSIGDGPTKQNGDATDF